MLRSALHDKAPTLVNPKPYEFVQSIEKMLPDRRQAGAPLCMTKLGALSLRQQEESVYSIEKMLR